MARPMASARPKPTVGGGDGEEEEELSLEEECGYGIITRREEDENDAAFQPRPPRLIPNQQQDDTVPAGAPLSHNVDHCLLPTASADENNDATNCYRTFVGTPFCLEPIMRPVLVRIRCDAVAPAAAAELGKLASRRPSCCYHALKICFLTYRLFSKFGATNAVVLYYYYHGFRPTTSVFTSGHGAIGVPRRQ
jgi:hypothetical protein